MPPEQNGIVPAVQIDDEKEEVELGIQRPEPNVPETDQRTHVVLTDERFMEYLARCPRGLQKDVSAVLLAIKGWQDEIVRLRKMEKLPPDGRGNVRVLKDRTTYHYRVLKPGVTHPKHVRRTFAQWITAKKIEQPKLTEDDYEIKSKTVGIYTVLPAIQIPLYRRKFERQTAQALDWVWRMMRLWVGEDGKGRTEMIDALQASNGKLLPPTAGTTPLIFMGGGSDNGPRPGGWAKNR